MKNPQLRARRHRFESLENRNLLAGDITVQLVGGSLIIRGDDSANAFTVQPGATANSFVVTGETGGTGAATQVRLIGADGTPGAPAPGDTLTVENVRGGLILLAGQGDDEVGLAGLSGGLNLLDTGAGDDTLSITDSSATITQVRQGSGNDTLNVNNLNGIGLDIISGPGDDAIAIAESALLGTLRISTGGGEDNVALGDNDDLVDMSVGALRVFLGNGADTMSIDELDAPAGVYINGGGGADDLAIDGLETFWLNLAGGAGVVQDNFDLTAVNARIARIQTGGGDDTVSIQGNSQFTVLNIDLSSGDDILALADTTSARAILNGGAGANDELDQGAGVNLGREIRRGFEVT